VRFLYLIRPVREGFAEVMLPEEETAMTEHFDYLKRLHREGMVQLAGPCLDAAFGIVIFEAPDIESARKIMANDPAVYKGVMQGEVHPYRVSLVTPMTAG